MLETHISILYNIIVIYYIIQNYINSSIFGLSIFLDSTHLTTAAVECKSYGVQA